MDLSLPLRLPRSRARSGVGELLLDALRARRLSIRVLVCVALALPLLGGGWMWLRNSSLLLGVRHVHIAGVHGAQSIEIRDALAAAASRMSTLHFSVAALRAAVVAYPEVAAISASASLPHTLSIHVSERLPVATLVGPGERTAIAADGTVLGPALASAALPSVAAKTAPAPGTRVHEASALAAAAALGAAPAGLLRYVTRAYEGPEGLTLQMRNGLLVYFGDGSYPHAKWLSLARVLSSPGATGAVYVDVRLPERPAAGFSPPGSSSAAASTLTPAQVGTNDPAAAKLAEQLSREVGGLATPSSGHESESSSSAASGGESTGSHAEATGESAPSSSAESEAPAATPTG
ncbi:MAG TPA: FtsQ-type POTRA domain-containing protein [Solirubrobacteraceae bacterium]|jgi:cell division protein FtsQ|nr:FtsQ-type POTRA domain-containing protein [Solirubrobacteraceae bacterium]